MINSPPPFSFETTFNLLSDQISHDVIPKTVESKVIQAYGQDHWGALPIFAGNFINFGYWEGINIHKTISLKERIQSSLTLYLKLAEKLQIEPKETIAEAGCGTGIGTLKLAKHYSPQCIIGLDITPSQIQKARYLLTQLSSLDSKIRFYCRSVMHTGLPTGSISKIISVEALQHFSSVGLFVREAKRILKKGGRLGITTFFATSHFEEQRAGALLPLVKEKIENAHSIGQLVQCLHDYNFKDIEITSIGKQVFPGFEQWITQIKENVPPVSYTLFKAFQEKCIDYYQVTATSG